MTFFAAGQQTAKSDPVFQSGITIRGKASTTTGDLIGMETAIAKVACKTRGCANSAVIAFLGRDFCLDHFFSSCYERLDLLEPMIRARALDVVEVEAARAFLQECSHRALFISLRHAPLTNLDRSRLLEILLSCGDLELLLRKPGLPHSAKGGHEPPNRFADGSKPQNGDSLSQGKEPHEFNNRTSAIPQFSPCE